MVNKQVKDVEGVIKRITQPSSKEFDIKHGPKKGGKFTSWSIGILLDNDWYNIKATDEAKVLEYLYGTTINRNYQIGDEVKIYLESEDDAGKYWRITSIVPLSPMDDVPVEKVGDNPYETEEEKKMVKTKEEVKEKPQATQATQPTPVSGTTAGTENKDLPSVTDYKSVEADKYELGMAKQNAALLLGAMIQNQAPSSIDSLKEVIVQNGDYYDKLTTALFNRSKKVRKQILGY